MILPSWLRRLLSDLRRELPVIVQAQRNLGALRDDNGTVIAWTAAPGGPPDPEQSPWNVGVP